MFTKVDLHLLLVTFFFNVSNSYLILLSDCIGSVSRTVVKNNGIVALARACMRKHMHTHTHTNPPVFLMSAFISGFQLDICGIYSILFFYYGSFSFWKIYRYNLSHIIFYFSPSLPMDNCYLVIYYAYFHTFTRCVCIHKQHILLFCVLETDGDGSIYFKKKTYRSCFVFSC